MPISLYGLISLIALSPIASPDLMAQVVQWPIFRGPEGSAHGASASLPDEFGPTKNKQWHTDLPPGHSSPILWDNKIFITGHEGLSLEMLCLNRLDGTLEWSLRRRIENIPSFYHIASNVAASTPATNGEQVVFYFDQYGLITTDMDGKLIWEHRFGTTTANDFGYGASPIIHGDSVLLNRDGALDSGLFCFELKSGKMLWKAARLEAINSYCSPHVVTFKGESLVLQGGSGELVAYDLQQGTERWKATGLPGFACVSPVAAGDMIYYGGWSTAHVAGRSRMESFFHDHQDLSNEALESAKGFFAEFDLNADGALSPKEFPEGRLKDVFTMTDQDSNGYIDWKELDFWYTTPAWEGKNAFYAIQMGGKGDITQTHVKWQVRSGIPYVCSPLVDANRLYLVKKGGFITCVDVTTGRALYQQERLGVGGEYYATPVSTGDRILIAAERGTIFVLKAGPKLDILVRNEIGESLVATPAIADDTLYLRSFKRLWAFRQEE